MGRPWFEGLEEQILRKRRRFLKPVFSAERLTPRPKQTQPSRRPRPPTASPASPGWWPRSCPRPSTSQVSERLPVLLPARSVKASSQPTAREGSVGLALLAPHQNSHHRAGLGLVVATAA